MAEYIEREAAIKLLHYNADESCSSVIADFEALPAEDVTPVVHGEWQYVCGDEFSETYKCKKCEHEFDICVEMYRESLLNYCPSCGAKMEEARHS